MQNKLMEQIFKLTNRSDIDSYVENILPKIKSGEVYIPQAYYLEAMYLYNMYLYAMDFKDVEGYLYPYKLRKIIEIANELNPSKPTFSKATRMYTFSGSLKISELNQTLEVLINYANIPFICKIMTHLMPHVKKLNLLENVYVAIAVMKLNGFEVPVQIGQYYTVEYIRECGEQDFYKSARDRIKKLVALSQLPEKVKAMYFQLPVLYKSLEDSAVFDFGSISLQCFKIIEQCTKDIIKKAFDQMDDEDIWDILPLDLQQLYKRDTFKVERLEIGKIIHLLNNLFDKSDVMSQKLQSVFKNDDVLNSFLKYVNFDNINKYRNPPAHGEYLAQEVADEALEIMNGFIYDALYKFNKI